MSLRRIRTLSIASARPTTAGFSCSALNAGRAPPARFSAGVSALGATGRAGAAFSLFRSARVVVTCAALGAETTGDCSGVSCSFEGAADLLPLKAADETKVSSARNSKGSS